MSFQQQQTRSSTDVEVTAQQSIALVKNLVRTAISTIAYIRNLFPEDCFEKKGFSGTSIRMQLPKCNSSSVLHHWLEDGVFDAIEKGYQRSLMFGVYTPGEPDDVLVECYEFEQSYTDNTGAPNLSISMPNSGNNFKFTREGVRDGTARQIRTLIILTETLNELPQQRYVSIKLLYRDNTPADYEPVHFSPMEVGEDMVFEQSPYKVTVGSVETRHHTTTVKVKTTAGMFKDVYNPAQADLSGVGAEKENAEESNVVPVTTAVHVQKQIAFDKFPNTEPLTDREAMLVDKHGYPCSADQAVGNLFNMVGTKLRALDTFSVQKALEQFPHIPPAVIRGIVHKLSNNSAVHKRVQVHTEIQTSKRTRLVE